MAVDAKLWLRLILHVIFHLLFLDHQDATPSSALFVKFNMAFSMLYYWPASLVSGLRIHSGAAHFTHFEIRLSSSSALEVSTLVLWFK